MVFSLKKINTLEELIAPSLNKMALYVLLSKLKANITPNPLTENGFLLLFVFTFIKINLLLSWCTALFTMVIRRRISSAAWESLLMCHWTKKPITVISDSQEKTDFGMSPLNP